MNDWIDKAAAVYCKLLEALLVALMAAMVGMIVTQFPPEEVAKLSEKMKPVIAKYPANVGEALVAEVNGELAKLRK
jgi:sensor domain CHASE-containing protein